ncbi:MAG: serine/threonine protein kinase [Comamonadaceae bacterium]|nr:serine/threonine protein kinase [Comamonadaceae bacterium]
MNTPSAGFKTASSSLPAGTRLAEFEITGVIGEGGFGIVYSANDSSLERMVAIKEYLPSAFAQRGADGSVQVKSEDHQQTFQAGRSSFINEARMLAKFSHPGLVEVFRFWEANETAYMAMRYYRGVTLREALRSSRHLITEQWLCETLDPVLLALRELHNEKCFHRDIAPDNILVLPNGRSVLMDFGAARRIISGMTQALTTVLKPGYAPIEQYYDDGSMPQGAWTDVYAVGGLLYHVMTGKVPVQAISRMISDPLKPVSDIAIGEFSQRLCDVVMKCMAVMPENRYQSVDELRTALGWVTTPVLSTVLYQPPPAQVAPSDFPATVLLRPSSLDRAVLAGAASPGGAGTPELPDASHSMSPKNAPVVPPKAPEPEQKPAFSINELTNSSAPRLSPVSAKQHNVEPGVSQDLITPKIGSSGLLWTLGAVVLVVVLVGFGYFVFGSKPVVETVSVVASPPIAVPAAPVSSSSAVNNETPTTPVSGVVAATAVAPVEPISAPTALTPASVASDIVPGNLRVELAGGWGKVFVDGVEMGTVPPVLSLSVGAGQHDIEIRNPAMATEKRSVTVIAGKTVVLRHAFVK